MSITHATDGTMTFDYTFGGEKIKKISPDETRTYLGGVEYKNGQAEMYYHGDGRVALSDLQFQYKIADHLGNTVVLFEDDGDGLIVTEATATQQNPSEVLQRNLYYPFGLAMEGIVSIPEADPSMDYLYNGKELNTDFDLNWLDYGARYYDPAIARWGQIDPLATKGRNIIFSPYVYVYNNPILFVDPDGRNGEITIDKSGEKPKVIVNVNYHWSADSGPDATENGIPNDMVTDYKWKQNINDRWSGERSLDIDGTSYDVVFKVNVVDHDTHEEAIAAWKADPTSNFL